MKKIINQFPWIKDKIKTAYLFLLYLQNKKKYRQSAQYQFNEIALNDEESFFGYYDKFPQQGNQVLFYSTSTPTYQKPSPVKPLKICIYDTSTSKINIVATTTSYNWQQGCRAHWLGEDKIIYNVFEDNRYKAVILDTKQNKITSIFKQPVQDSFKEEYFLSINYRRLYTLRPDYGYKNLPLMTQEELYETENDGIWYTDIATGEYKLLITLKSLSSFSVNSGIQKINHITVSPSGDKFAFMHRRFIDGKKIDQLFISDLKGKVELISDYGMVSHYYWRNNNEIIGFMAGPQEKAYYKLNTQSKHFTRLTNQKLKLYKDGHPTGSQNTFISDTYPDKSRIQHLFQYNLETDSLHQIGEFFHSLRYRGESRCDLHPRYNEELGTIFFDSVLSGRRKLYKMGLKQ